MSSISNELVQAYRQSRYRMTLPTGECELQIGQCSALLDEYLQAEGCRDACFITAHNPRSFHLPPAQNQTRQAALEQLLLARRQRFLPGVGYGTSATLTWPAEPGFLVLDCGPRLAAALGRLFGQYAVLFVHHSSPVQLLWCEQP